MPFWTYILRSESTGKLYKGQTNDLGRRIEQHNNPELKNHRYTLVNPGPWELFYSEKFETRAEAMKREKFFKSGKGREWIKENL